jgi:phosphatidylinositol glycan class O
MEEDTILFVMGDHGMTADGNHGGHTESEVTAALFVYTPSTTFNRWDQLHLGEDIKDVFTGSELGEELKDALLRERATGAPAAAKQPARPEGVVLTKDHFRQVSQIDVVPTIALLLGLPIPFGNLGGVIPELFLGTRHDTTRHDTQIC